MTRPNPFRRRNATPERESLLVVQLWKLDMQFDHLISLIENFALLTCASVLLFLFVIRTGLPPSAAARQLFFGVVLGVISVLVVKFPIQGPMGATFDTRAAPVVLAGFYAGPLGGIAAAIIGAVARYNVGGPAAIGGVVSFFIYACAGVLAGALLKRRPNREVSTVWLIGLAVVATVAVLPSFFIGQALDTGLIILGRFWHILVIGNLAGIVCLGLLLDQMLGVVDQRNKLHLEAETAQAAREVAGIGIWSLDFRTGMLTWDDVQFDVMGKTRKDFEPTFGFFRDCVHEDDVEEVERAFEEARRTSTRFDMNFRIRLPNRSIRHIRAHAKFVGGRHGDPDLAVGVGLDETRERSLIEELALKSLALDNAVCGIVIAEAAGDQPIVFVNRSFTDMTGYGSEEVIGHNCRFMNEGIADQPSLGELRRAIEARSSTTVRLRNRRKDGTYFWNNLHISPIRSETGDVTHFIGVQEDVTDQVEARIAAESARDRLNAVVTTAPDAIITVDVEQRITTFNPAAERVFGWRTAEIVGRSIDVLIPEAFRQRHHRLAEGYLGDPESGPGPMTELRTVNALRRDGTVIPVIVSLGRFVHEGEPAVAVTIQDMTDIVAANQSLSEMTERLTEQLEIARNANEAKDRFLAHMSHELRTPLNAVIGFADMIGSLGVERLGSRKIKEYANDIHSSGAHLLSLINDILDLSRIESGKAPIHPKALLLDTLIDSCTDMISPIAAAKGVNIRTEIEPGSRALADARALQQCVINVLSNAVKFSRTGDTVLITAALNAGGFELRISDQGIGIAPEVLERIGQPFMRSAHPTVAGKEGTGLGLAITRGLMQQQGGWFSIRSTVGFGTTVTLGLPAVGDQSEGLETSDELQMA